MKNILFLIILIGCASYKGKVAFKTETDIFYTDAHDIRQSAEAYIPKEGENFPGVILVHGGGWNSRDLGDNRSIGESLASNGYTVFNINHRFPPKHKHPAPIEDLESALDYFKKNAKHFKVNPEKIGLWGYSSGGHITALFALQKIGTPKAVQAVVSGGTPFDLTWYPFSPIIKPYLGGFRDQKLKEYFEASPTFHVKAGAPPFFIYHASNDKLVEFAQSAAFEAKLKLHGNFVKRLKVPYWGHLFAFAVYDYAVEKGIHFLDNQLKGPKK